MPGPYAHITLLHELLRSAYPESIFSPASGCSTALGKYFHYTMLGAVSPDYPNLATGNAAAAHWADVMHCTRASEMISSGIRHVKAARGVVRNKQLAWLLGYCAHVATDVTIHPVVQAKVGEYAENQRQHRICEMNQDSYIFRRMNLGEIGESVNFALNVAQCCSSSDRTQLDHSIVSLWQVMLEDVYPDLFVSHPPDCASWHRKFVSMVDGCSGSPVKLFPLAGVIAAKMGLEYPGYAAVDRQFIEKQIIPASTPLNLHYDEIFDHAVDNVAAMWKQIDQAMCAEEMLQEPHFGDWNLDNGCDERGTLVFWE
jgi:hypothetical protein